MGLNYAGWELDPSWAADESGLLYRTHPRLWNLAWLMYPELDGLAGRKCDRVPLPDAQDLLDNLDQKTWFMLSGSPLNFIAYFAGVDDGSIALTQGLPYGYIEWMKKRAAEAERRLFPTFSDNVVYVNFRRA